MLFVAEAIFSKKRDSIELIALDVGLARFGGFRFELRKAWIYPIYTAFLESFISSFRLPV